MRIVTPEYRIERVLHHNSNITHNMVILVFSFAAHLLPGIFLVLVGYVGCDIVLANVCLAFALAFNGAAIISNLSNNQDLAPNFAGFLYGIINTIGSISGIIIPPMVEEIAGKYGVSVASIRLRS